MVGEGEIMEFVVSFFEIETPPGIVSLYLWRMVHEIPELFDVDERLREVLIVFYAVTERDFKECQHSQYPDHIADAVGIAEDPHAQIVIAPDDDDREEEFRPLEEKGSPEILFPCERPGIIRYGIHFFDFPVDGIVL